MSDRLREALETHGCVSAPHDEDDFVDECGVCTIDAAARRFLALTETGPDYEAAGRKLHDFGGVQGNWECGSMGSDPRFPECGCVENAKSIVVAALADYLTEEE